MNFIISQEEVGQRSAQRPQCRQTFSSLTMTRPVGRDRRDIEGLLSVVGGGHEPGAEVFFVAVVGEGDARSPGRYRRRRRIRCRWNGSKTVCTSQFRQREASWLRGRFVEAEFHFDQPVAQRFGPVDGGHRMALVDGDAAVVKPVLHAHFLADQSIGRGLAGRADRCPGRRDRWRSPPHGRGRRR